jgi:hypothetical protein
VVVGVVVVVVGLAAVVVEVGLMVRTEQPEVRVRLVVVAGAQRE